MKALLLLFITTFFVFANKETPQYIIKYNSMKIGKIKNFNTIKDGYLIGEKIDSLTTMFLPFDNYIIYSNNKPKVSGKNKYKKDNSSILKIINSVQNKMPRYKVIEDKKTIITIRCNNNRCDYIKVDKLKNKFSDGYIILKDNLINIICDTRSNISFERI
jgi:hypothetical protein